MTAATARAGVARRSRLGERDARRVGGKHRSLSPARGLYTPSALVLLSLSLSLSLSLFVPLALSFLSRDHSLLRCHPPARTRVLCAPRFLVPSLFIPSFSAFHPVIVFHHALPPAPLSLRD